MEERNYDFSSEKTTQDVGENQNVENSQNEAGDPCYNSGYQPNQGGFSQAYQANQQNQGWYSQPNQGEYSQPNQNGYSQPNQNTQWSNPQWSDQNPKNNKDTREQSELGILAFVFSFIPALSFVSPILAVIDIKRNDDKRHDLSLITLAVCEIPIILVGIIMAISTSMLVSMNKAVIIFAIVILALIIAMAYTFVMTVKRKGRSSIVLTNISLYYVSAIILIVLAVFMYIVIPLMSLINAIPTYTAQLQEYGNTQLDDFYNDFSSELEEYSDSFGNYSGTIEEYYNSDEFMKELEKYYEELEKYYNSGENVV